MRAGARVVALLLAGFAIASVMEPNITTRVANAVGVGRGTDLLLYVLVVAFAFTSAGLYFRSRDLESRLDALTRSLAIRDAVLEDGPPGGSSLPERPSVPAPAYDG
jgi:hypothetical protein